MAYNNNYNGRGSGFGGNRGNYNSGGRGNAQNHGGSYNAPAPDTSPLTLPDNYVDKAEEIMQGLSTERSRITTSKIRSILTLISDIYNVELTRREDKLTPEDTAKLQMARVRIAYECGREESVKIFAERAKLLNYIRGVGDSRAEFIRFARYMEALVAYHRFYGGRDN